MTVSKEQLLCQRATTASGMPEDEVAVPGVGTVRVRGLNRGEAHMVSGQRTTEATERKMMALGMVDPAMSETEVGRWMEIGLAGEIERVCRRISELSGMATPDGERPDKAAYKSVRGRS